MSQERAVELAERALLSEHQERPIAPGPLPAEVVTAVRKHEFGWLVSIASRAWLETGEPRHFIVGGGPILVDGEDGSVYMIPILTFKMDHWQDAYRRQVRGHAPSDAKVPLSAQAARTLADEGRLAALRFLRRRAPALDLKQTITYVSALEHGVEPSRELVELSEPEEVEPSGISLVRMAGPELRP